MVDSSLIIIIFWYVMLDKMIVLIFHKSAPISFSVFLLVNSFGLLFYETWIIYHRWYLVFLEGIIYNPIDFAWEEKNSNVNMLSCSLYLIRFTQRWKPILMFCFRIIKHIFQQKHLHEEEDEEKLITRSHYYRCHGLQCGVTLRHFECSWN